MRLFARGGLAVAAALALATGASAAYVCHPDPAGTRTLKVRGDVLAYQLHGDRVTLLARTTLGCRALTWNVSAAARSEPSSNCGVLATPDSPDALRAGGEDTADRLVLRGRSWPLPERAANVDVYGPTAIFATKGSREVYALDVRTGRSTIIGLTRHLDHPQIGRAGVVFQDNLYKENEHDGTTVIKFLPSRYVVSALRDVGSPINVRGRITDISMDGSRVAVAVRSWKHECDAVLFWNVTWRYSIPITEDDERTCTWSRAGGSIGSVAIAGLRAAWTMRVGRTERVVSASSVDCFERVVATVHGRAHLAGDGALLSFGVGRTLGRVGERMRGEIVAYGGTAAAGLAADNGRVAVLRSTGTVEIRTATGDVVAEFRVPGARTVALRAGRLVVLTRNGMIEVRDVTDGAVLSSWRAPRDVSPRLDVHFGVAVLTAGREVVALDLSSGRRAVVARAPARARAQIEAPGIVYAYNAGASAHVEFIPFASIEAALR